MRENALWYPKVPSEELYFNESPLGEPLVPGYRPVIWNPFGSEDRSQLSSLTKITFTMIGLQIYQIDIFHNTNGFVSGMVLGPYGCWRGNGSGLPVDLGLPVDFLIDEPGGERINGMQVMVEDYNESDARYFDGGKSLYYKVRTRRHFCKTLLRIL